MRRDLGQMSLADGLVNQRAGRNGWLDRIELEWVSITVRRDGKSRFCLGTRAANDLPERPGRGHDGDTQEPLGPVRNPLGAAAVEPEGEFLEVTVEMFEAHRSLMGAEDPSLEQREDEMNAGQHLGRGLIELGHTETMWR